MTNNYNSGLYTESFYNIHEISLSSVEDFFDKVEFDQELLLKHYMDDESLEYKEKDDGEDKWELVNEQFWDSVSLCNTYYEPKVFDEKLALECGLTPFKFEGRNMLALSGYGMDLSPKLDAYQALSHGTIDKRSKIFTEFGLKDFKELMGEAITKKVFERAGIDSMHEYDR